MGRRNVAAVCAQWAHLPHRAWRLLVFMGNTVRDEDAEPRYYGGRDALADVIGAERTDSGFRAVERAVSDLLRAGAIDVLTKGGNGRRAEYLLTAFTASCPTPTSVNSEELPDTSVGRSPTSTVELPDIHVQVARHRCRANKENEKNEIHHEDRSPQVTPLRGIRLGAATKPDPPPDPEDERARQAAALDAWSASHLRPVPTDPTTRESA